MKKRSGQHSADDDKQAFLAHENGTIHEELLLAFGAVYLPVPKGQFIFREGTYCRFYHQLVSGRVRWMNIKDDGREYVQSFVERGECFGELPLFDDGPYAATAVADVDSVVIRLKKDSFLQLIQEDPKVHFAVSRQLARLLRNRFFFIRSFTNPSPEVRIHELFTWMKQEHKLMNTDDGLVQLTRQQIADLTGLRVETVIRTIRRMYEDGILVLKGHKIYYNGR